MPPKKTPEIPNADALIMAEAAGGELYVRNFENLNQAEQIIESDLHQLKALSLFGAINRKEFIIRHPETLKKQGSNAARSLEGVKQQRDELAEQARGEFFDSIGYGQQKAGLLEKGESVDELNKVASRQWASFQARYRRAEHADARNAKIRALRKEVKVLRSTDNREKARRPHLSDENRKVELLPILSTRERLIALRDDPRARFMPTTHREKNVMLSWLDYLDNPQYPLGINNQLLEVFNHQGKSHIKSEDYTKRQLPGRTVRTITYELHDYWTNAAISLRTLQDLEAVIDECVNPKVTLGEEAPGHPGLRALIRYRDLERLREKGQKPADVKDPLVTKEDRRPHVDPEKNKTVEDVYTRRNDEPDMLDYIANEADTVTIKDARHLVRRAVADQENREMFLRRRLEDIQQAPQSRYLQAAQLAGRLINQARIAPVNQSA